MKNNEKMCIITLNENGKIESSNDIEDCTLNDFGRDYFLATNQRNIEIDETKNGNVYFKYTYNLSDKIFMVHLYVLKNIQMKELSEDLNEIRTELKYRNEE